MRCRMAEKIQLSYRVSLTRLDDMTSVTIVFIAFFFLPLIFLALTHRPAPPDAGIVGNAILGGEGDAPAFAPADLSSLSNKQVYKKGHPLECRRTTDIEDVTVWIKGDIAKMRVAGKSGASMKYIITPDKVYAYGSERGVWVAYPADGNFVENFGTGGNVPAISYLSGTLNLYNCSVRDFDTTTLAFPDDV